VEVAVARTDTVVDAITATGQIEPLQSIQLRPEVDGRLVEILVREGTEVAEGTPLFKVDDQELKAQVARAQADRDLAQQALTRTRQLLADKAAAPADVERAEAQMRSTQAGLDLLQLRLDRTVVRAPFSGVAGQRLASLGDYVNNSTRLITLQTVNPQRAAFQVPERYADQLKLGQKVLFRVAALAGRDFTGTVNFVDPMVQLPGRTITVKAAVPNPRRELQSGMFIEARLETARRPNATVVPEDAVSPMQGSMYVWVIQDGKAMRKEVSLGVRTPGYVEVRSGVEPGDQVVVGGAERLSQGAEVRATVVDRSPQGGAETPSAPRVPTQ
jgi:membrane fusion protein (multidrug efflux system)